MAKANILVPDSSPELLSAVRTSIIYAVCKEGMTHREGSDDQVGSLEGTLARGPLPVCHVTMGVDVKCCHVYL